MLSAVTVLVCLVCGYVLVAADDLVFDLIYWVEGGRDRHRFPVLGECDLAAEPEASIALVTAAWREHDVIHQMLEFNERAIDYRDYEIFIGTYANDDATQAEVDRTAATMPRVHKAVNPRPGPSSKADNLNATIEAVRQFETERGRRFDLVMLHDPEDVIDPLELRVVNHHFVARPALQMIQLPIYPLVVPARSFTGGTYLDEFAEIHTKDIFVREWIRGFVPSAGVATTWRREALDRLAANDPNGNPFSTNSLTEDYDIGLKVKLDGMEASFVRQFVLRDATHVTDHAIHPKRTDSVRRDGLARSRIELVATRANFPHTIRASVRQRTRWTLGIVFQGWKNWGWVGDLRTRYLLMHDRKGPFSYTLVLAGYVFGLFLLIHWVLRKTIFPAWQPVLPNTRTVGVAIAIGTLLMIHRLLERAIATSRVFGWRQGLLAVARQPWSNCINLLATFRAAKQFARAEREGKPLAWDKTQHYVPHVVKR